MFATGYEIQLTQNQFRICWLWQCHVVFNRLIEKIEKQIEKNRQIIKFTKKK
jgi:hypothetical protein